MGSSSLNVILCLIVTERCIGSNLLEKLDTVGFFRDVSHCYYDHPGDVTMSVRLSRRDGCVVEEGNRRFSERLKLAEKKIDDGDFKRA